MAHVGSNWLKDDLDRKIIRELQRNAREATSTIAARLGVARSTVHERIARMEKQGVISGYSVVLSRNPSVENVQVMVFLEIKQQETRKILHRIAQYAEVRVCLSVNGDFDLFLSIEAPRIEDLDVVIDEIGFCQGCCAPSPMLCLEAGLIGGFRKQRSGSRSRSWPMTTHRPDNLSDFRIGHGESA